MIPTLTSTARLEEDVGCYVRGDVELLHRLSKESLTRGHYDFAMDRRVVHVAVNTFKYYVVSDLKVVAGWVELLYSEGLNHLVVLHQTHDGVIA
jgi:hypothetical protein